MRLNHISIHNFRGITNASMDFYPYTLIVGGNNTGKTTVIDCIRAFYEKDGFKFNKERDFPSIKGTEDQESWIELSFQLNNTENESLAEIYKTKNRLLTVRKYFQTNIKLHDGKTAAGSILSYRNDGTLSDEPFYGAKNVQSGKFGDLIYIPAISKVDEHTKLSGPSALRDLISNIMEDVVEGSDPYEILNQSVKDFSEKVCEIQNEEKRSLSDFENDFNDLLAKWETSVSLSFSTPSPSEIIKSMLQFTISDDYCEKPQKIEFFGSGFQRYFIYSLIRLGASYVSRKVSKKGKDFVPSLNLVLFEEPEAFLHPPQQDELTRNLIKVSENNDWQIICSTHSANFVSKNVDRIPAIIKTRRDNGSVRIFQISKSNWNSIVDANQTINKIVKKYPELAKRMEDEDYKPEMEVVKYFLWLNPYRAGIFFSDNVLLVEGPSEMALINRLLDEGKIKTSNEVYVMDCLGKYNIHRFMNLLSNLGVNHAVIYDDDKNTNVHAELNKLIFDSKHEEFTTSIITIPNNIESALGITIPKDLHKKPQHILYQYVTNQIDDEKIRQFCAKVGSCF